ncbi:MAG: glycosyltransferase [Variovorax sp.]
MSLRCSFMVPGDLNARTGGYGYDRKIIEGLRARQWQVDVGMLGDGYPAPGRTAREQADRIADALPDGTLAVVDGLAFGVLAELAQRHARRLDWVALVHHPLSLETGLDAAQRRALFDSERRALASARGVIVTSRSTARALAADFDIDAARIAVIEPGTDPAPPAAGSGSAELSLLCVATVTPRKGHAVLVEALAGLRDRRWTLDCAGSLSTDPACVHALGNAIEAHGRRTRRAARRTARGRTARAVCRCRRLRAALVPRGLWHGAGRSVGARAAGDQHARRRHRRHGACRRRHAGGTRRCRGLARRAAAPAGRRRMACAAAAAARAGAAPAHLAGQQRRFAAALEAFRGRALA